MTGRPCTVCTDPRRHLIDAAVRRGGAPARLLAESFPPLGWQAIRRHAQEHVGSEPERGRSSIPTLGGSQPEGTEVDRPRTAADLLSLGRKVEVLAEALLQEAAESGSFKDAASAIRTALEAHGKLMASYAARPPEFDAARDEVLAEIRDRLAAVLIDEPGARAKALEVLRPLAGGEA